MTLRKYHHTPLTSPQQMDELIMAYCLGEASPEMCKYLEGVFEHNELIRRRWIELKKVYDEICQEDEKEVLDRFLARAEKAAARKKRKKFLTYAAVACVLFAFIMFEYIQSNKKAKAVQLATNKVHFSVDGRILPLDSANVIGAGMNDWKVGTNELMVNSSGSDRITWNTVVVPRKLDYKIILQDRTVVYLNSKSELKFPSSFRGKREVYLSGEAYFEVKEDPAQPFIVRTSTGDITVLGTSFNVSSYPNGYEKTSLVTGKVKVTHRNKEYYLRPGKELICNLDSPPEIREFNTDNILSWRTGIYKFNNVPLRELLPIIEGWYSEPVVIQNAYIFDILISGQLDKRQPLLVFIHNLQQTTGLECYFKNESWYISR